MKKLIVIFLFFSSTLSAQYQTVPAFLSIPNDWAPTELINAGDYTNRLFLLHRRGTVTVFKNNPTTATARTFIDISSLLSPNGGETMGLAFHPNYENNRLFYISYYSAISGTYLWRIARFQASASNLNLASLSSQVNILTFDQPFSDHVGGKLIFGKDGYLYASTGDGHVHFDGRDTGNAAPDKTKLSGKMLRIDVDRTEGGNNYAIPPTNPYYLNVLGYRQEIFATGFRNPWKYDIDKVTGRIFLADVGDLSWEEIDLVQSGKDYGWDYMEGAHCFPNPLVCDTVGRNLTLPIFEYGHFGQSRSITGGFVYRGHLRDELYGKFIYGDYITGDISALEYNNGVAINTLLYNASRDITAFGLGEDNELYFCDLQAGIFKFYPHFQWGDVNRDGVNNLKDVLLIQASSNTFSHGKNLDADLNFDGIVSLLDLIIAYNEQL